MLNNLRILDTWTSYFGDPKGSELGILTALYSLGSIASLPIAPFIADRWGRKSAIFLGCVIMVMGAGVQAGAKNLDSTCGVYTRSRDHMTNFDSVHGWSLLHGFR
jgi:MFS family permease